MDHLPKALDRHGYMFHIAGSMDKSSPDGETLDGSKEQQQSLDGNTGENGNMNINSLRLIYFSPTGTTSTVLHSIARGLSIDKTQVLNLTRINDKTDNHLPITEDLVILGVPVYGGRVPVTAAERIRRIKGNGAPAAVVVVYGNRAYEDALIELRDLALEIGLKPMAGGAFIGEHSFASDTIPIANERPHKEDCKRAEIFGRTISQRVRSLSDIKEISTLQVPGQTPYKDHLTFNNVSPEITKESCNECETCISVCPTSAISLSEHIMISKERCILCCACVKNCPSEALALTDPGVQQIAQWLSQNFKQPKEPETFIA